MSDRLFRIKPKPMKKIYWINTNAYILPVRTECAAVSYHRLRGQVVEDNNLIKCLEWRTAVPFIPGWIVTSPVRLLPPANVTDSLSPGWDCQIHTCLPRAQPSAIFIPAKQTLNLAHAAVLVEKFDQEYSRTTGENCIGGGIRNNMYCGRIRLQISHWSDYGPAKVKWVDNEIKTG